MFIECPSCEMRYDVGDSLPADGAEVRCAKCGDVWQAKPLDSAPDAAADDVPESKAAEDPVTESAIGDGEALPLMSTEDDISFDETGESDDQTESSDAEEAEQPLPLMSIEDEIDWQGGDEDDAKNTALEDLINDLSSSADQETGEVAETESVPEEPIVEPDTEVADSTNEEPLEVKTEEPEPAPADPVLDATEPETVPETPETPDTSEPPDADFLPPDDAPQQLPERPRIVVGSKVKRKPRFNIPAGPAIIGATAACLMFAVVGAVQFRNGIVRALPGLAALYETAGLAVNVRGLEFRDIFYRWENEQGRTMLEVAGEIVNITDRRLPVPVVIFAMRNEQGLEFYQWSEKLSTGPLSPHASTQFTARIPAPPRTVRSLQLRFAKEG